MKFHHMCIVTTDLERAAHPWRNEPGLLLHARIDLPDGGVDG